MCDESVDITETSYALRNVSFINTAKEEAAFIKRLMTMNFKLRVVQYVIDIVTLCGGKMIEFGNKIKSQKKINGKYLLLFH